MARTFEHLKAIPVRVVQPKSWAAGVPAVASAYQNISAKVGPIKGSALLSKVNQLDGFDCPGCAWPDPFKERSNFEFCENGAKAVADEATLKRADRRFFARHSVEALQQQSDRWLNEQGRLVEPMVLHPGDSHYTPVGWDEAIALIAAQLTALPSPDQAAFYTSGRASNEAAFIYQLLVRAYGTNNLPDCSNMCHESSGVGLSECIGVGKGTVTLDDFEKAQLILVFGQNPGSNHPRMLSALQKAKRAGARIVSINPLDETGLQRFKNPQEVNGVIGTGTALRDLHLPVKINGDVALLKGLCRSLIASDNAGESVLDHAFISQFTDGYEAFAEDVLSTDWSQIESASGLSRASIEQAAELLKSSRATICCWAMGMTQHKNAVSNVQMMTHLLMLQGNLGKPGAGVCPVRGHSNVQGDRTMGIWEKPTPALLTALADEFSLPMPQQHGVDTVDAIHAMAAGQIKVLFALGGNFFRATPDHQKTVEALAACDLTVQVSTKLNRSHLFTGKAALILPALGRTERDEQASGEQFVTVENSMGIIQTSRGQLKPASHYLKSEVRILAELAQALLPSCGIDWLGLSDDYHRIREHIARVIPGFEGFNQRLASERTFYLPNAVRDARRFDTETQKARFFRHALEVPECEDNQLLMMTIRSHDQFNTTVYTDNDRYRGVQGSRRVVFVNRQDRIRLGFKDRQWVSLRSHWPMLDLPDRDMDGFQLVDYAIPQGCCATYYPETNDLIPLESVADKSNTPAYKSIVISIHPSAAPE